MYLFEGRFFRARHIKESDAGFIFKLRKSDRAYGLNPISDDINDQIIFIKDSIQSFNERKSAYIIIEDREQQAVGAFRFTNLHKDNANYQSLISAANLKPNIILETIFCVYQIFFEILNLKINPEMAVKNKASRVINLHKKMGITKELSKDEHFTYFEISREKFFLKKNFYNKIGYGVIESSKFLEHFGIKKG